MMPMYRYMDSHPEQRNQTFSFPQCPYSMYQPNPPMSYVPWPYGGNFGYPNPVPCYSCCNHSHAPGYNGFRPSYPQTAMASPVHFAGGCPAPYHEGYPFQYVPPPHYSMDLPRYDYDKKMPGNYQCCECPNHSHQNKGVKIEEQEAPDVVEKAPKQMIDYPYPVFWIPPEYMKGEEQRKVSGPKIVEEKKNPGDERPPVSLKSQEGDQMHGFLPVDMNKIGSLMQGGNGERFKDQRSDDRKEFPFPIFWMPSYDDKHDGAGKEDKGVSQDQQTGEQMRQLPFPFFWFPLENKPKDIGMKEEEVNKESRNVDANTNARVVPTKHTESSDNGTRVNEAKSAEPGVLDGNQKVIPVKQVALPKKEDNSEDTKRRGREVPVKHVDDSPANKPSGSSVQSQSSSPKKSSRLPPVCLRVDPLRSKKKNGGGGSRSPSPPGHTKVQKETSVETSKASASSGMPENSQQNQQPHDCISNNAKEVEPSREEKVIEVVDKGISENKDSMHTSQIPVNSEEASTKPTDGEDSRDGSKCEFNEDQGTGESVEEIKKTLESANSVAEGTNFEKKRLSDVAAAVLIQSAYRGYMVRRWEPIKKLKQIAEIREQVADIRNQITSLETSDLKKNDKQRVVIGETIMRLLLRLDTIQGLLPSLRDMRRSLARELVLLQEKLDDKMSKKSEDTTLEVSAVETVDGLSSNGNNSVCMSEQQVEEAAKVGEEFPPGVSDNTQVATESCQAQVTHTTDSVLGVGVDVPVVSEHTDLDTACENEQHELPMASDLNSKGLDSGPTIESTDNVADGQLSVERAVRVDVEMANGATQLEQCGEVSSLAEEKSDHSVVSTASEARTSPELPQEAVNTEPAAAELENVEAVEIIKDEMKQGGEVGITMSADVSSPIATDGANEKEADMHELTALQLSTTDEDSGAASELNKNEEVQIVMDNDVSESVVEETVALPQEEEGTVEKLMNVGGEVNEQDTVDVVHHHQNEASIDDPLPAVSKTVEPQPLCSAVETSTYDMVHENELFDLIGGNDACLSTLVDADMPDKLEIEESIEGYKDLQAVTVEEVAPMEENRSESKDSINEQSDDDTAKEDILIEKSEPLPASPTEVPSDVEGARKLIEENEKLREVMQKLLVAGNEQLQVISDLTGRVKHLEKKLAKKKKVKTRRCRAATSWSSCVKPSSNHLKERASVAM